MILWVLSLAIWASIVGGLVLIVHRFHRVTKRLGRRESWAAQQRKLHWPKLPPGELAWLLDFRRRV